MIGRAAPSRAPRLPRGETQGDKACPGAGSLPIGGAFVAGLAVLGRTGIWWGDPARADVYAALESVAAALVALALAWRAIRATAARDPDACSEQLTADRVTVWDDERERDAALEELDAGTLVVARPGERLAVDGLVCSGRATVEEALITGESAPREVGEGDQVFAGSLNLNGRLVVRTTAVSHATVVGRIAERIAGVLASKPRVVRAFEAYSRVHVPVLMALAAAAALATGSLGRGLGVLIAGCPCALLLATPCAMTAALAAAGKAQVLVRSGRFFEALADARVVVLDKTGTLTAGRLEVAQLAPAAGSPSDELAAAVLRGRWSWLLTTLAVACFASLFVTHIPVPELAHDAAHASAPPAEHDHFHADRGNGAPRVSSMRLHLRGMLLAFAGAAAFVAYFVGRVRRELDQREVELAEEQRRRAQAEKLESLATLAAGAAHELATPLATIAVVARELELLCAERDDAEIGDEVRVIERETARCRSILGSLAGRSGELRGESWETRRLGELLEEARAATSRPESIEWILAGDLAALQLRVPRGVLAQTIQCLLQNAIDASTTTPAVQVVVERRAETLEIAVVDRGSGMPPQVLHRLGEPFFTTKEAGRGLGLGVFVARRVVEQWGGALDFTSRLGAGTTARLRLPITPWLAKPQ